MATGVAAKGRCAALLGQRWDAWAAMLAAALLAAMHWAQLQAMHVAPESTDSAGCSAGGTTNDGSQQQQQQQPQLPPRDRQRLGQAAFELASAGRLLLPAAIAGLPTLQREQVPRLMNSLGKHCAIDSTSLQRYVQVLAL